MSTLAQYRKAIAALLGTAVAELGALASLGFLSGRVSHDAAVALICITPIAGAFGVVVAPKNADAPVVPPLGVTVGTPPVPPVAV